MTRAAVLGAGSWGTTFAKVLADAGCDVMLHARRPELAAAITEQRQNPDYLPGVRLPSAVVATADLLREVTDLIMSRIRDQLGELRGEQPPTVFHPRPARELPGTSGSAA